NRENSKLPRGHLLPADARQVTSVTPPAPPPLELPKPPAPNLRRSVPESAPMPPQPLRHVAAPTFNTMSPVTEPVLSPGKNPTASPEPESSAGLDEPPPWDFLPRREEPPALPEPREIYFDIT